MYISKISVKNFRSIDFVENLELNKFNVFVGQNNHGKTNFFEAIEWFYNGSGSVDEIKRKGSKKDDEMFVEIEFTKVQQGLNNMKNEKNRTTLKNKIEDNENVKIICRLNDKQKVERKFFNPKTEEYESTGTGANNFLNDFLPKLQFVKTENNLKEIAKYGKTTEIGQMLSGVISEVLASEDEDYKNFLDIFERLFVGEGSQVSKKLTKIGKDVEAFLKKQFPECEQVEFNVKSPKFDDLLKNFETKVDDGYKTTAQEKGDGMQRALMLAIIQTYAEYRKENEKIKNFVFLVDEAELHLHPTAQRNLKEALMVLAEEDDQVLISSHSSVLISDEFESQKLFRVEKSEHKTNISEIKPSQKQDVVYELLGGSPGDLLLPRNFLVVEGLSESKFLTKVIERFYSDKPKIKILYAEGNHKEIEKSMHGINKAFIPLYEKSSSIYGDRLVLLCDKRDDSKHVDWNNFVNSYNELNERGQIIVLPEVALEIYYPVQWAKSFEELKKIQNQESKIALGREKVRLAEKVGLEISQNQFESEMNVIFEALKKCWDNAF
jgi:putative ATP-dependent endonuclease of OLD family